jgi:hypothetical protein
VKFGMEILPLQNNASSHFLSSEILCYRVGGGGGDILRWNVDEVIAHYFFACCLTYFYIKGTLFCVLAYNDTFKI